MTCDVALGRRGDNATWWPPHACAPPGGSRGPEPDSPQTPGQGAGESPLSLPAHQGVRMW